MTPADSCRGFAAVLDQKLSARDPAVLHAACSQLSQTALTDTEELLGIEGSTGCGEYPGELFHGDASTGPVKLEMLSLSDRIRLRPPRSKSCGTVSPREISVCQTTGKTSMKAGQMA